MRIQMPHSDVMLAVAGTSTAGTAGVLPLIVALTPMLQFAALIVSIIVGVLTGMWTYVKLRHDLRAAAELARAIIAREAEIARQKVKLEAENARHDL